MEPDQQTGDYGYDMAHERDADPQGPGRRAAAEAAGVVPPGSRDDREQQYAGDYSYDEAHGF